MQVQNAARHRPGLVGTLAPNSLLVCLSGSNNLNQHKTQPVKLLVSLSLVQNYHPCPPSYSSCRCCNLFSLYSVDQTTQHNLRGGLKKASMPCHDSVDDGPRGTLSRTNSILGATVIKSAGGRGEPRLGSAKKQISRSRTYVPCKV